MDDECPICYHKPDLTVGFFHLSCCSKKVCHACMRLLTKPVCPFCREHIHNSPFQYSVSAPSSSSFFIPPSVENDDNNTRTHRRRLRRLRKLQQREEDRIYNRMLSRQLAQSYHEHQKRLRQRLLERDIMEDHLTYGFLDTVGK